MTSPMQAVQGQQHAAQVIENIKAGYQQPDYLFETMRQVETQASGYQRAFLRQLQKALENIFMAN